MVALSAMGLLLGAALRLAALSAPSPWLDEASTLTQTADWTSAMTQAFHPPGYYVLATAARGLIADPVIAVRGLSVIAGVLTLAIVGLLARQLSQRRAAAASVAVLLLAAAPAHIHFSREGRMYSLWVLGLAVAMLGWVMLQRSPEAPRARWTYLGGLMLAALSHYYAAFYVVSLSALVFPLDRWLRAPRTTSWQWLRLHAPMIVVGVAMLAWLAALRGGVDRAAAFVGMHSGEGEGGTASLTALSALVDFRVWSLREAASPTWGALALLSGMGLWGAAPKWASPDVGARRWLLASVAPTVLLLLAPLRLYPRLLLPLLVVLAVAGGGGLAAVADMGRPWGRTAVALMVGALLIASWPRWQQVLSDDPEPWRRVCARVEATRAPVLISAEFMRPALEPCLSEGHAPMVGFPDPDLPLSVDGAAVLARAWPMVWVIYSHTGDPRLSDVDRALVGTLRQQGFALVERHALGTIAVFRLQQRAAP